MTSTIASWPPEAIQRVQELESENARLKAELRDLNAALKDYGDSAERGGWQ